ncbi:MAG: hypothetical protein ABW205_08665 [Burkholderiales bacterium]
MANESVKPDSEAARERMRDRFFAMLLPFLLTGVIGTMVGAWFQQRGWAWQNRVAQVEKDTGSALDALHSVSELLDKRWSATLQMLQTVQDTTASGDSKAAAEDTFRSVNHDWEMAFANIDSAIQFNVDRPFFSETKSTPETLWKLQCESFAFGGEVAGGVSPESAHVILKVIDHCHDVLRQSIEQIGKASNDAAARKALIRQAQVRLEHIYHINDVLRCVILERAVSMRSSLDEEFHVGSLFQIGTRRYSVPPRERQCVERYRAWAAKH